MSKLSIYKNTRFFLACFVNTNLHHFLSHLIPTVVTDIIALLHHLGEAVVVLGWVLGVLGQPDVRIVGKFPDRCGEFRRRFDTRPIGPSFFPLWKTAGHD